MQVRTVSAATTTTINSTQHSIKMNTTIETQEQTVVVFAEALTAQEDEIPLLIAESWVPAGRTDEKAELDDAYRCYATCHDEDTAPADLKPDNSYGLAPLMGWVCVGALSVEVMTRAAFYLKTKA